MNEKKEKKTGIIYINNQFIKSVKDLKNNSNYILFTFILFFLLVIFGFFFPIFFQESIYNLLEKLKNQTEGLGLFGLIRFIISNNLFSSFIGMIGGIIFTFPSLLVIIVNGYILGFVARLVVNEEGIFVLWRLLPHGILEIPAILLSTSLGIKIGFEMIANSLIKNKKNKATFFLMIISLITFFITYILVLIYGFNRINDSILVIISLVLLTPIILFLTTTLSDTKLRKKFKTNLFNSLRDFIFVIIPLFVVAGIIESLLLLVLG